jgi:hypothetical protein
MAEMLVDEMNMAIHGHGLIDFFWVRAHVVL